MATKVMCADSPGMGKIKGKPEPVCNDNTDPQRSGGRKDFISDTERQTNFQLFMLCLFTFVVFSILSACGTAKSAGGSKLSNGSLHERGGGFRYQIQYLILLLSLAEIR